MNMLYIVPNHDMTNCCCGVTKKIKSQKQAFSNLGVKGEMIYLKENELYKENLFNEDSIIISPNIKKKNKYKEIMLYIIANIDLENLDCIYIRYPRSDRYLINFVKKIKKINKNIKILVEIVTYPYDKEDTFYILKYNDSIKSKISYTIKIVKDRIYRRNLKKYIDRIVTFSEDECIFGIKTLITSNGIDKDIIITNKSSKIDTNIVNMIGVGGIAKHHGFDRVILGISNYNKENENKVCFHIVGDGLEVENLKKITVDHKQDEYVKFHGYKSGEELNILYEIADVAIGSIGRHRNNIYQLADLKSREYCAKGIPFIKTVRDIDFENFEYCLTIDANENAVDIEKVIYFYDNIKRKDYYELEMAKFAKENLTWENKLLPVIDYVKNKKENRI
ncbi:glycosyltransferase [Clostridium gasigenes]|uniref:glycosyltransferase n=1 Tax=Clostridium gasigenes TaxID=94869 RepID=UPI001C0C61CE|nr:glycosyltransferase [Clostridium gasigenes]MBU3107654.1 glycosyltransferase [Clostridium gasigenes]